MDPQPAAAGVRGRLQEDPTGPEPSYTRSVKPIRGGLLSAIGGLLLLALFLPGLALGAPAKTRMISVNSKGAQGSGGSGNPAISANGRFVTFYSWANNLVPNFYAGVLIRDRRAKTTRRVTPRSLDYGVYSSISAHGRYVAFEADDDIFVRDMETDRTRRVNVGAPTSPAIWASQPLDLRTRALRGFRIWPHQRPGRRLPPQIRQARPRPRPQETEDALRQRELQR